MAAGILSVLALVAIKPEAPPIPVLSNPQGTATSPTTATVGFDTTINSGNAYFLRRSGGSAASAATIIATGEVQAVSGGNPQNRPMTGFAAGSSNNYVDMAQTGPSNVVTFGPFSTPPTFALASTLDAVTSALLFQQSNSMTVAAALDQVVSNIALGIQPGIINVADALAPGSGTPWASRNDVTVRFLSEATGLTVLVLNNVTTDSQGRLPQFSDPAFQVGQWYEVVVRIPLSPPALGIWRYQAQ